MTKGMSTNVRMAQLVTIDAEEFAIRCWERLHGDAARLEGWYVMDCSGSDYGRWQIQHFDSAEDGETQLDNDEQAWAIVLTGKLPHHVAARQFIQTYNQTEWQHWMRYAPKLRLDRTMLEPELVTEITAAVLSC